MKLIALHNAEGKILAAVLGGHDYKGPVPVASESTTLTHIAIADEHRHLPLSELCEHFRVSAGAATLVAHRDRHTSKT